ncbi:MAG: glycosyltransferase family 2 protein, partial [Treponema sp.]|nr:glycosyltransferase family 2 protein [Treponema sp.]
MNFKDDMPLISFVIPFYKRYNLVKEALESIISSGFDDIEIILVDDASCSEDSPDEEKSALNDLLEFTGKYKNIIYVRQEENRGPGAARNRGILLAKGEWLFFMDCDDIIYGDALPELADFLESPQQQDADMVIFNKTMFKYPDGGEKIEIVFNGDEISAWRDELILEWNHEGRVNRNVWCYCYRKTFLLRHYIKCGETYQHDDDYLNFAAACYAEKISAFPRCFYEYRMNSPLSLTMLGNEADDVRKKINGRVSLIKRLAELCESDIPRDRKARIENLLYRVILYSLYEPELRKKSAPILRALDKLRGNISRWTDGWQKNIYISPCFLEAAAAAKLINE